MEYGLIGEKLGHSFSAEIHKMIGDYGYEQAEIAPHELKSFLTDKNFRGVNVTIPYKRAVIPYLNDITPEAEAIGAVNCIRRDGERLIGHNTDYDGLKALMLRKDNPVLGKKVLILGTGGTSDTADAVCRSLGAEKIVKVSRTPGKGQVSYEEAEKNHSDAEVIINATPCGMFPNIFFCPTEPDGFEKLTLVVDAIYNPLRSLLVTRGKAAGADGRGGLYMLVAQAVAAAEFFFNRKYPDGLVDEIYEKLRRTKENIVLTGMPGSGKTTIGAVIAQKLGRELVDTDRVIEARAGKTIKEIFNENGEAYFRDMESRVIKDAASKSGIVIATGGGAILRNENVEALKLNGKVFFIDREPELLKPTDDRPTASTAEAIMDRYKERYPLYTAACDCAVKGNDTPEETALKIIGNL